jgi:hypothetical protein
MREKYKGEIGRSGFKIILNIDHNQTFICIFISLNRALPPFLWVNIPNQNIVYRMQV